MNRVRAVSDVAPKSWTHQLLEELGRSQILDPGRGSCGSAGREREKESERDREGERER